MKYLIIVLVLFSFQSSLAQNNYMNVGDIQFNASIDNKDFKVCDENNIKQYYSRYSSDNPAGYKGEKRNIEQPFLKAYKYPISKNQTGYITIRFLVNCHGESDRFRVEEMDFKYNSKVFNSKISSQLLNITKQLKDWIPRNGNNQNYDFYQYLTFKIKSGQIIKILP